MALWFWRVVGRLLVAAIVAFAALRASDLLQPPSPTPFPGHGAAFAAMSVDPLAFAGGFPQRILAPLLAHLVGLDGARFPLFQQLCSGLLLAVVFLCCRARGAGIGGAIAITVAIAGTGAVQVYKLLAGYSDSLNLVLLLIAAQCGHRPVVFWGSVLLAAFSHEMVFFFAPWLLWHRHRHGGVWWRELSVLLAIAGLYKGWRMYVAAVATGQAFDATYYVSNNFFPLGTAWLWGCLLLMWLVLYGPLLLVFVWAWRTDALGWGRLGPLLFLAGMAVMFVFAYDVQRFCNFIFVPLALACVPFLARRGTAVPFAIAWLAALGIYRWQHPPPGAAGGALLTEVTTRLLQVDAYHDYSRAWTQVAPAIWPGIAALMGATATVVAAGLWAARRWPARSDVATGTCSS
ncbi:MAG: hypothetical protein IPK26_08275 [Planctomycetes bacterium]|nr:hypothetical protein [Planctomycetota bacterium]